MHPTGLADTQLWLFFFPTWEEGEGIHRIEGLLDWPCPQARAETKMRSNAGRAQLAFRNQSINQSITDRSLDAKGTRFYLLDTCFVVLPAFVCSWLIVLPLAVNQRPSEQSPINWLGYHLAATVRSSCAINH